MLSFRELLHASAAELTRLSLLIRDETERDPRLEPEQAVRHLGLNATQLLCGVGFNPRSAALPEVSEALGFGSYDDLCSRRNFLFINDVYRQLPIDDVLALYSAVAGRPEAAEGLKDVVESRLARIEGEVESTINPIMIGSYKLEIRGLYEHGVMSGALLEQRLGAAYSGLRALTNEVSLALEHGVLTPEQVFFRNGVSPAEKRRLVLQGQVPKEMVLRRLADPALPEAERSALESVLQSGGAG